MMDANYIYCGDHVTINVTQIIMLYTLHLYSALCQLSLGEKR